MRIIEEKLTPPPLPPSVVARERLNAHFVLDERVRLQVVQAPSGYGKTTLLAERLTALEQPAVWLRLDARDDRPERFACYFQATLERLFRDHLGREPGALDLGLGFDDAVEEWLACLPDEAASCRLVIDEFEHLHDPVIIEGLRYWLRHQPPWLTLTVISRTLPELGMPALRLRGELEEIGMDALAFDLEEAQTLCAEQLSFPPTRVSLDRALRRTEGWVMALNWLVERTTTRAGFDTLVDRLGGAHPDFVAWFDELLRRNLGDDDRHLLLQLGVLERFSPELVARLLEGDRVTQRLDRLEQAGLFITRLDPHGQWCRFHTLFSQYLHHRRHELSLDSQRQLHRRASEAWLALGDTAMALAQAIQADDPHALAGMIEQRGPELIAEGHFALLERALEALGEPRISESPRLTLVLGWVTHAQQEFARTERCINWIEAEQHKPEWSEFAAEFATLSAQLAINQGDAARAAPLAEKALTLPARYLWATPMRAAAILGEAQFVMGHLEESLARVREVEREAERIGHDQLKLHTLCQQSEVLVAQGRLQAAFDVQERAFAHMETTGLDHVPMAEFLYRIRSQLLWEWYRLDEAEHAALQGIAVLDAQGERWALQCHTCLANVAQARGDETQCADHIRRIRKGLAEGDYHIDWLTNAHATLLTWWESTNDMEAVARWLQEAPPAEPERATNHFAQCNVRNRARALTLLGEYAQAESLLNALEGEAARLGLVTDANRNRIALAALAWAREETETALGHTAQALVQAGRTTVMGSFLRLGQSLRDLLAGVLAEWDADDLTRARAERLLEMAGRQHEFGHAMRLMLDEDIIADIVARPDVPELIRTSPLTRREWQILGLIYAGLSNEQIAEQLTVAPTTIKTHIRSLYQKQNISCREEAIAFAGDLLSRVEGVTP
ncbi:HTH-type transcriptional regulator MalT [Aquisalimonas asiatica]|uniref:HTH-type transcriptional regulator MalT n=1 Tax=Aquisalimonas asiatica TaxID=406100 RepID=A0A1H8RIX2_9GAMM|nr:HTH-type transcriptional regulator MalT [Aquisalimonas asiatica]SEO66296.1 LuxR family transcriptional regulator, maltose regulon positive regulatory protein [Aquisalimonas asiatica]